MALLRASIRGLRRACSLLPRSCGRGAKRRVCLIRLVGRRCARPPRLPARRSRDKPPRGHHTGHRPRRGACPAGMGDVQGRVAEITGGAGGHIVNTASMAGLVGMRWLGVYCASKFAVVGLSEALHRELAEHGIGVSVLCPMIVETKINENSIRNRPAALRNLGEAAVPEGAAMMGSVIGPEEVARRVVRGIERKDLYIFTHPEQRAILQRRAARQDRMFEPDRW